MFYHRLLHRFCLYCSIGISVWGLWAGTGCCSVGSARSNSFFVGGASQNQSTGFSVTERAALKDWFCGSGVLSRVITDELLTRKKVNPVIHLLSALQHSVNLNEKSKYKDLRAHIITEEEIFVREIMSKPDILLKAINYIENDCVASKASYAVLELMNCLITNKIDAFLLCLRNMLHSDENAMAYYLWGRIYARGELGFPKKLDLALRCIEFSAKQNYVLALSALEDWSAFISVPPTQQNASYNRTLVELFPLPF